MTTSPESGTTTPEPVVAPNTLEAPLLQLDAVTRFYPSDAGPVRALGPVDLEVFAGEFVALMGPSGSGKSTLLAVVGALDQPTGGSVRIGGIDLGSCSTRQLARLRRREIGFVFQDLNLLPGLTALENVSLPLELDGVGLREAAMQARRRLAQLGIESLHDRFPEQVSGGERQRIAIARACVGPRRLLLADEPTGALDSTTGEAVMRALRDLCDRGTTVMLVTHDAGHAAFADRVLHLRDGELLGSNKRAHVDGSSAS